MTNVILTILLILVAVAIWVLIVAIGCGITVMEKFIEYIEELERRREL